MRVLATVEEVCVSLHGLRWSVVRRIYHEALRSKPDPRDERRPTLVLCFYPVGAKPWEAANAGMSTVPDPGIKTMEVDRAAFIGAVRAMVIDNVKDLILHRPLVKDLR